MFFGLQNFIEHVDEDKTFLGMHVPWKSRMASISKMLVYKTLHRKIDVI